MQKRIAMLTPLAGTEVDSNDVLVGEGRFDGKGGNMIVGGMGGEAGVRLLREKCRAANDAVFEWRKMI